MTTETRAATDVRDVQMIIGGEQVSAADGQTFDVVNPATGQIQCRAQFDPAARAAFDSGSAQVNGPATGQPASTASRSNAGQRARLDADIAACVPYNPFGATDNTASINYFSYNAHADASLRQFVASGFVSGDSSQWFELPGGPARFATTRMIPSSVKLT